MNIASLSDKRKNKKLLDNGLEIHDNLIDWSNSLHPRESEFYYQLFPRIDEHLNRPLVVMNRVEGKKK